MHSKRVRIALTAIALSGALPAAAQTVTMEAESMALSSYAVENGNRIKLTSSIAAGTASKSFSGASGTYNVQVFVVPETDGQSTLEVYRGTTLLQSYKYPLSNTATSFTISNVALTAGEAVKLIGRPNAGAIARVDKLVFTPVASSSPTTSTPVPSTPAAPSTPSTPSPTTSSPSTPPIVGEASASATATIEAESMALSSYAVENGNRIRLTSSTAAGTASKTFGGASGTYNMRVYVMPETDGQSTLEVYKGATQLGKYIYPLSNTAGSFAINNVALSTGDTIKLVGWPNGGAVARVDKVVLTRVTSTPSTTTPPPPTTSGPPPTTPSDPSACVNPSTYEGFGRTATGGAGKAVYRVTNLNDSGAGSLRDAVSQGNRCIVFDVGGTISLQSNLLVHGANLTIDGLTAPAPGVTLNGRTLVVQGASGAGNVVVRGIRLRNTPTGEDGMRVYQASTVMFDRVSVSDYGDGAIDITENSKDVTIQWSILGAGKSGAFTNLIGYNAARISTHHNLYINGSYRHPYCGRNNGATSLSPEVVCDVRNNLVWNYAGHGTAVMDYGTANIVNNYYYTTHPSSATQTISLGYGGQPVGAYLSGNYSQNGWALNGHGTTSTPYSAVAPATSDPLTAARQVLVQAGARGARFGLDSTDLGYVGQVSLP